MAKDRRAMANPFAGIKKEPEGATPAVTAERPAAVAVASEKATKQAKRPGKKPSGRVYMGFRLSPELIARARAVSWAQRLTLTAFVERSIGTAVHAAERSNGGPFPVVPDRQDGV